ncbi:MAG: bifunctional oligoribonuclease/PAP phosphatase NrnA [Lachnospiraceae bacterium]|nr:bifunctional oligoribonuclease/PAP phosphatase NrnA [Lachnospiraceae bacterium]
MDFEKEIAHASSIAIGGHIRPDGDCVGSTMAAYNYIKKYFPDVKCDIYLENIPNIFKFLNYTDEIQLPSESVGKEYDLFLVMDCGDGSRLGDSFECFKKAKRTVCIDHHVSNDAFADSNYIVPDASSTCELFYTTIEPDKITKEIAECIYVGMVHDTGVFQYSCTHKSTMEIAGDLMERGIDYSRIIDSTYYTKTYEQNLVQAHAILKSKKYLDGQILASFITQEEMKEYNVLPKHLDGIVNQLRITKDVEVAIFLYQLGDKEYKASTRCKTGMVDLSQIAVHFGGGGHKMAAGFGMKGDDPWAMIDEIVKEVSKQL